MLKKKEYKKKIKELKIFKLSKEHSFDGYKMLKKIGLKKNSWFVTLHVREPGFRGETERNTKEKFRNANPLNYIEAAKTIIKKGGYVFRVGHKSSVKMPNIGGLIDYANSNYKSPDMDVFLAAKSKFCIGNSSGFMRIARYFSVPILLADGPKHCEFLSLKERDIYLPRLFKNEKSNKPMSFKKMFEFPYNMMVNDNAYSKHKISTIENTSDEINSATQEMIELTLSNRKKILTKKQKRVSKIIEKSIKQISQTDQKVFSRISSYFLNKHSNLI